jgi:surface antigen
VPPKGTLTCSITTWIARKAVYDSAPYRSTFKTGCRVSDCGQPILTETMLKTVSDTPPQQINMRCTSRLLTRFLYVFSRGILVTFVALLLAGTALVGVPQRASASSELLCRSFSQCSSQSPESADYATAYLQSFWGMTSGHNCTNYVAYRLTHHGRLVARPPGTNSASTWGQAATDAGVPVSTAPQQGDVAWWGPALAETYSSAEADGGNHVAIVEAVHTDGSITISEDNLTGDFQWRRLSPGSGWPSGFIRYPQSDGSPSGRLESVHATAPGEFTLTGTTTDPDSYQTKVTLLLSWGGPLGASGSRQQTIGPVYPSWRWRLIHVTSYATSVYVYALNNSGTPGASRVLLGSRIVSPYRTATSTSHIMADRTITARTVPSTTITVAKTATYQPYPAGTVSVRDGSVRIKSNRLYVADRGTRRIYLPRLSRGTHYLRVHFRPSDAASRASYSTVVKVVVR